MISKDFVFDLENNLSIVDGDFEILQSDNQNIEAIIKASKGQFYQFPLLGYGITNRLNSPFDRAKERKEIREELGRDFYDVTNLEIESDFIIYVDAEKKK